MQDTFKKRLWLTIHFLLGANYATVEEHFSPENPNLNVLGSLSTMEGLRLVDPHSQPTKPLKLESFCMSGDSRVLMQRSGCLMIISI